MNKRRIPPVHPGEIFNEDFLKPLGISQYRLALAIGVPPRRVNEIIHGRRRITADTALRFSRFFEMEAPFWLNLQSLYDLETEQDHIQSELQDIKPWTKVA